MSKLRWTLTNVVALDICPEKNMQHQEVKLR